MKKAVFDNLKELPLERLMEEIKPTVLRIKNQEWSGQLTFEEVTVLDEIHLRKFKHRLDRSCPNCILSFIKGLYNQHFKEIENVKEQAQEQAQETEKDSAQKSSKNKSKRKK